MESSEEIFVILRVAILMGILQNLTHNSYLPVMSLLRLLYLYKYCH